jgi:hypothetical protein
MNSGFTDLENASGSKFQVYTEVLKLTFSEDTPATVEDENQIWGEYPCPTVQLLLTRMKMNRRRPWRSRLLLKWSLPLSPILLQPRVENILGLLLNLGICQTGMSRVSRRDPWRRPRHTNHPRCRLTFNWIQHHASQTLTLQSNL